MAVTVQIPTLPAPTGYIKSAMLLDLPPWHAEKLRRVTLGLIADGAQLNGVSRVISDEAEALMYLVEVAAVP